MSAQATLVMQFGNATAESAFSKAEMDETLNVDTDGESISEFSPGDSVWFWVQHDDTVEITEILPTGGQGDIVDYGMQARTRDAECTWPDTDTEVDLGYIPSAMPTLTWYGNPGSYLRLDGRVLTIGGNAPATADAVIPIQVHLFRFIPPSLDLPTEADKYRVVLCIYIDEVAA